MIAKSMQLFPATVEDASAIASVHIRSWNAAYENILPTEYLANQSVDKKTDLWREILLKQETKTLVVRHDSEVVGFVSYGQCRDHDAPSDQSEIWALYVDPSVWRRGAGMSLMQGALDELYATGKKTISLRVFSKNRRGRAFYEACGFKYVPGSEKIYELGGVQVEDVKYLLVSLANNRSRQY